MQASIAAACRRAGRDTATVRLLPVSKTKPEASLRLAYAAGCRLLGENKVQEVKEKFEGLKDIAHEKHFIGNLQTNNIKDVLKYGVTCIESVDRIDLAEKLHQRLLSENKTMDVFIQVNTSAEESKFGVAPEQAIALIEQVAQFETIRIKGLMTIGLFSAEAEKVRPCFKLLKSIQQQATALNLPNVDMRELSMGMSGDLEIAIAEGATIVRVGTAIFGQRIYPDSHYWNESKQQ